MGFGVVLIVLMVIFIILALGVFAWFFFLEPRYKKGHPGPSPGPPTPPPGPPPSPDVLRRKFTFNIRSIMFGYVYENPANQKYVSMIFINEKPFGGDHGSPFQFSIGVDSDGNETPVYPSKEIEIKEGDKIEYIFYERGTLVPLTAYKLTHTVTKEEYIDPNPTFFLFDNKIIHQKDVVEDFSIVMKRRQPSNVNVEVYWNSSMVSDENIFAGILDLLPVTQYQPGERYPPFSFAEGHTFQNKMPPGYSAVPWQKMWSGYYSKAFPIGTTILVKMYTFFSHGHIVQTIPITVSDKTKPNLIIDFKEMTIKGHQAYRPVLAMSSTV